MCNENETLCCAYCKTNKQTSLAQRDLSNAYIISSLDYWPETQLLFLLYIFYLFLFHNITSLLIIKAYVFIYYVYKMGLTESVQYLIFHHCNSLLDPFQNHRFWRRFLFCLWNQIVWRKVLLMKRSLCGSSRIWRVHYRPVGWQTTSTYTAVQQTESSSDRGEAHWVEL